MNSEIDVNVSNVGIVGASGEGKSYYFEHTIFPMLNKSILLIDSKNQYKNIEKSGYKIYKMKEPKNPVKEYANIIKKIKFKYKKDKFKVLIIWFPEKIEPISFNKIVGHWTKLGNNTLILEEAHDFKYSILRPYEEFEQTMRKRTGLHNKNANVWWLSQLPHDMPRPIWANSNALIIFSQWDNIYSKMVIDKRIPDSYENPKSKSYDYHIISR